MKIRVKQMGRKFEIIYLEIIDIVFCCFCKAFFDTRTLRSLRLFEITKASKREHVSMDFPKKDIKDCRGDFLVFSEFSPTLIKRI